MDRSGRTRTPCGHNNYVGKKNSRRRNFEKMLPIVKSAKGRGAVNREFFQGNPVLGKPNGLRTGVQQALSGKTWRITEKSYPGGESYVVAQRPAVEKIVSSEWEK